MNSQADETPPVDLEFLIDKLCDEFEDAFLQKKEPHIEAFLDRVPSENRDRLLEQLLSVEFEYSIKQHRHLREKNYLERFPSSPSIVADAFVRMKNRIGAQDTRSLVETSGLGVQADNQDHTQTGKHLGEYELLSIIAQGGMGIVYLARQKNLKRHVAIKMILTGRDASSELRARFRSEAESVAALQHPNIVQIYDIDEHEECGPFIALEYIDGGNVGDLLKNHPDGRLPSNEAASIIERTACGIEHAHQKGIIHRDLKPANILMTRDGTPKVTDFGLAKQLASQEGNTQTGAIFGTPAYMAPEQAQNGAKGAIPQSDVYALGAILYELITGEKPFSGDNFVEILDRLRHEEPKPPMEWNPQIDASLNAICLKCLEKDPANRYATARELTEDLAVYNRGDTTAAEKGAARPRTRMKTGAFINKTGLLVAAVATILAALSIWTWFNSSPTRLATPYEPNTPFGLPPMEVPVSNELTVEKIALGKKLFFEKRISANGKMSCSTCHMPEKGWSNGEAFAQGADGTPSRRSVPSIVNVAYASELFWDGRSHDLEEQAIEPITNPFEMGIASPRALVKSVKKDVTYRRKFAQVFDDGITAVNIGRAIAAFERTILAGNAPVDRYRAGDESSLSDDARRGMEVFFNSGHCSKCHSGPTFSDHAYHNLGVGFNVKEPDQGRQMVSGKIEDRGAFKTPTLRDVVHTAPYMHNGSLKNLEDVVEFYNKGGIKNDQLDEAIAPLQLTEQQKKDLVVFLKEGLKSSDYPQP